MLSAEDLLKAEPTLTREQAESIAQSLAELEGIKRQRVVILGQRQTEVERYTAAMNRLESAERDLQEGCPHIAVEFCQGTVGMPSYRQCRSCGKEL